MQDVGDRVFFETSQAALSAAAQQVLDRQAAWLAQHPHNTLLIEGHTDARGTRAYNLALGERRAAAVRAYLTGKGVEASRLSIVSYGEARPQRLGASPVAWTINRRAVSVVQAGAGGGHAAP